MIDVRSARLVGSQIADWTTIKCYRRKRARGSKGDERPMPVHFVPADAHRRIDESVAEDSSPFHEVQGVLDLGRAGIGTVKENVKVFRPELDVACHRLAVQSKIV